MVCGGLTLSLYSARLFSSSEQVADDIRKIIAQRDRNKRALAVQLPYVLRMVDLRPIMAAYPFIHIAV